MLLCLRVIPCFTINFHPLKKPTLPIGKYGLSFTVVFFVDANLMTMHEVNWSSQLKDEQTHFTHYMLVISVNLQRLVTAGYAIEECHGCQM